MRLLTYCDREENEFYRHLCGETVRQGYLFENAWTPGTRWNGFFSRWTSLLDRLTGYEDHECVVVLDGLDVFIVGPLSEIERAIVPGVILMGRHGTTQRKLLPNTCNRNAGILMGTAMDLRKVAKFLAEVPEPTQDKFHGCDQSYLNYVLNHTSELNGLEFRESPLVFMNGHDRLTVEATLYHAVGMHDYYRAETSTLLKHRLGITTHIPFLPKRYLGYVLKWLSIETRVLYWRLMSSRVGDIVKHMMITASNS